MKKELKDFGCASVALAKAISKEVMAWPLDQKLVVSFVSVMLVWGIEVSPTVVDFVFPFGLLMGLAGCGFAVWRFKDNG